jgi:transcriptional regulator with XRE-family HTH domain
MARAALDWGVRDLARAAQVSTDTVSRLERGEELKARTVDAIRRALEDAGAEFLADEGVRLQPTQSVASAAENGTEPSMTPGSDRSVPQLRKSVMEAAPVRGKSRLVQLRASREQSMTPVSHVR